MFSDPSKINRNTRIKKQNPYLLIFILRFASIVPRKKPPSFTLDGGFSELLCAFPRALFLRTEAFVLFLSNGQRAVYSSASSISASHFS